LLYVYIINKKEDPERINLNLNKLKVKSVSEAYELVGQGPDDLCPVWQECSGLTDPFDFEVKGTSITVVKIKLK
jgi:hypothetical protein